MNNQSLSYKLNCSSLRQKRSNSSLLLLKEKGVVITTQDNVSKVYNNHVDKNVKTKDKSVKKGNLIPTEYRKVFWTLVASQKKFDKIFDKLIVAIDKAENEPIKVKETAH